MARKQNMVPIGKAPALLKSAKEIRNNEHRLSPRLRLSSQAELIEFIHAKGLVSVLGGNELPSAISAVLGKPWKPSSKGFSGWNVWWSFKLHGEQLPRVLAQLERRNDVLASRIFDHSKTFVSDKLWPAIGPIVEHRETIARKEVDLSSVELNILDTIKSEKSIRTDRLRKKLGLEDRASNYKFHRALSNLESRGLIVGAEDPNPETHLHANVWQTWAERTASMVGPTGESYKEMVARLLGKTIDSCVLVEENRVPQLFEWKDDTEEAKERLLNEGIIVRLGNFLAPSRALSRS